MNPDTGRLYESPEPHHLQRLVPAPHANRNQVRRMRVMRNEPCPCGGGKKFKTSCMNKDRT